MEQGSRKFVLDPGTKCSRCLGQQVVSTLMTLLMYSRVYESDRRLMNSVHGAAVGKLMASLPFMLSVHT
jgi:hypothetical protein